MIVTVYALDIAAHPVVFTESLTVKLPEPEAPQVTEAVAVPCPDEIVPPVTVQTYVLPVFAGVV